MSEILRPKDYDLIVKEVSELNSFTEVLRHIESCIDYYAPKNYYFHIMLSEAFARIDNYDTLKDMDKHFLEDIPYSEAIEEYADSQNRFIRLGKVYADFLNYEHELVEIYDDDESDDEELDEENETNINDDEPVTCNPKNTFYSKLNQEQLLTLCDFLIENEIISLGSTDLFLQIFSNIDRNEIKGKVDWLIKKGETRNHFRPLFILLYYILDENESNGLHYQKQFFFKKILDCFNFPINEILNDSFAKAYYDFYKAYQKKKFKQEKDQCSLEIKSFIQNL